MAKQTTKERIIRQSIEAVTAEIESIQAILNATPAQNIIAIRKETQRLLDEEDKRRGQGGLYSQEFLHKLEELSEQEKEQFGIVEKRKDFVKLMDRQHELKSELNSLHTELSSIELRKAIRSGKM